MENPNEKATKIKLILGSAATTATLNDSVTARDLLSKLPQVIRVSRSSVDYCGVLFQPLNTARDEARPQWINGEISYIPGADYLSFFFDGEADSASYGYEHHIVGRVDDLAALKAWPQGSIELTIEPF